MLSAYREGWPEEGGDDGSAGCGQGRFGALPPQRRHGLPWHVPDVAVHTLAVRHILQHHLRVPCTESLIVLVVLECLVGVCPASVLLESLVGVCPVSAGSYIQALHSQTLCKNVHEAEAQSLKLRNMQFEDTSYSRVTYHITFEDDAAGLQSLASMTCTVKFLSYCS